MHERLDEFAETITSESGKPIRWARAEVERAAATFRFAAEEALLDSDPSSEGRLALVRRVPRGPVLGITPFNFPLNLVAHKVASRAGRRSADRAETGVQDTAERAAAR
jgi:acyl-CoA reductase-like NAD-dependent aldehyde dehydrogenase